MSVEQAIRIEFTYGLTDLKPYYDLSSKLDDIAEKTGLGEYDGHEMALDLSDGLFFLYAPDAKKLYEAIKGALEDTAFMKGAKVTLRLGPIRDNVEEIKFSVE